MLSPFCRDAFNRTVVSICKAVQHDYEDLSTNGPERFEMPESPANVRRRFVSAQDVAERAGVSRSAVSRAFTPGASIAPETLARVQEAADALGYQVNALARGLLAHRSQLVGLVTSDPDAPFRAEMIAALSAALIERGNVPALITIGPGADDVANASRQLLGYRAEATVFLSGSPPASLVELTRRNGQALILINRAETDIDSVRCDDRDGVRQAFEALRATGASHFGVVNAANPSPSLLTREQVFSEFAAAAGVVLAIARAGHSDYGGGREAASKLLAGGIPPQALFCVNDSMAIGVLDSLRGAGLKVPEDVSVVGFDDLPMAAWAPYRLTTIRQDPARIAKAVVALLDRRASDPDAQPTSVRFPVELVIRETVGGLR